VVSLPRLSIYGVFNSRLPSPPPPPLLSRLAQLYFQAPIWKLLFGVLLLVLLVLVILFPAFLFSTLNPTLANNFVTGANIDVCTYKWLGVLGCRTPWCVVGVCLV
jgi:hypothetical protein